MNDARGDRIVTAGRNDEIAGGESVAQEPDVVFAFHVAGLAAEGSRTRYRLANRDRQFGGGPSRALGVAGFA